MKGQRLFQFLSALSLFVLCGASPAQTDIDAQLARWIRSFGLTSPPAPLQDPPALSELGYALFVEKEISGYRDISCAHCHSPQYGGSDGLMFSFGTGVERALREGVPPQPGRGGLTVRHSPHLVNLKSHIQNLLFWDGRVAFDPKTHTFNTPEPGLNGANPPLAHITSTLSGALAAQALFPMVNTSEMLGLPDGDNEIARSSSRAEAWDRVVRRLVGTSDAPPSALQQRYRHLFGQAYPQLRRPEDVHIGHVGTAIASFISVFFDSRDTPYDQYIQGNTNALSYEEKLGMDVFFGKARCGSCHHGPNLSNEAFFSVGTPEASWTREVTFPDLGRYIHTLDDRDRFAFKTPGLRNLPFTAPYMHNGSLITIAEVIEHYNKITTSLRTYRPPLVYEQFYGFPLYTINTLDHIGEKWDALPMPHLQEGLALTADEKFWLEMFLTRSLADPVYWERVSGTVEWFP